MGARLDVSLYRAYEAHNEHAPQLDVDTLVALKLLLHILEEELECLSLPHLPRRGQLL